ncbi:hypothetical protein [Streptomyces sp. NPDC003374]
MPRGRHRHSPPLHRLLPPSAIAGVSVVCALGPWVFTASTVLRSLAAVAAATAVAGAVVMRRWDAQAGRRVADLTRARASDEWRFEERLAELEADLDESRELRVRLEQKLRAKRAELAGLRNEHAALLRRYATAETERASALEGRRLLEIEAGSEMPALTSGPSAPAGSGDREDFAGDGGADAADAGDVGAVRPAGDADAEDADAAGTGAADSGASDGGAADSGAGEAGDGSAPGKPAGVAPAVFSPEGSRLFLRAGAALARLAADGDAPAPDGPDARDETVRDVDMDADAEVSADEAAAKAEDGGAATVAEAAADAEAADAGGPAGPAGPTAAGAAGKADIPAQAHAPAQDHAPARAGAAGATADTGSEAVEETASGTDARAGAAPEREDEPQGQPGAAGAHERAAAAPTTDQAPRAGDGPSAAKPSGPVQRPSGHFTVPTAVAVVPAAPARRPVVEGGFDFFGTQKGLPSAALDAVRNEDLADVVGQEALALHKAEAESQYRPADVHSRAGGQVIDLTAHDETEQIDLQNLRTAAS